MSDSNVGQKCGVARIVATPLRMSGHGAIRHPVNPTTEKT
jgi:hypothetical protein